MPVLCCPAAKVLASTLDASFDAALLLSLENGRVLHQNLHALLLLLGDHEQRSDDDDTALLTRWIELQPPHGSWDDVAANLQKDEGHRVSNVAGTLKKDGTTTVTINFALVASPSCCCGGTSCENSDNKSYVAAYLKTGAAPLSVDEASTLQLDRDLVDGSFDPMFVIDGDGIILMVNEASTRAFGYSPRELLHHNISMVCGDGHGAHHGSYLKHYLATGEKKVIGKVRKMRARRKDGTEFAAELGVREISASDGVHHGQRLFCGYLKDVSEQERHEKELVHRETLMQCMINSSFDPMFQIDERGVICMVNNAAVQLFGHTREEYVGNNISMICGGDHAARHSGYLQAYLTTGCKKIIGRKRVVPAVRKDGTEFEIELGVQEVQCNDTGERMFCGYVRDLTQQRLDKRALRKKDAEMMGKFFGGGGHEKEDRRGGSM